MGTTGQLTAWQTAWQPLEHHGKWLSANFQSNQRDNLQNGEENKNLNICIWSSSRTVFTDDNCVNRAAGKSYQTWEVPRHGSAPISSEVFYPFIQTSLETYLHNLGLWHGLSMQLPTDSALVLVIFPESIIASVSFPKQSWFITALSRKPLPEESHRSDFVLCVNPALEGHSHLHGRKQETEASWRALRKAYIFIHSFMQPTNMNTYWT